MESAAVCFFLNQVFNNAFFPVKKVNSLKTIYLYFISRPIYRVYKIYSKVK